MGTDFSRHLLYSDYLGIILARIGTENLAGIVQR